MRECTSAAPIARWGLDAQGVASADEALAVLRRARVAGRRFDVALIDHHMPDRDGLALGRLIAADATLEGMRSILLTSSGANGDLKSLAERGFAGYLLKPVSPRDLAAGLVAAYGPGPATERLPRAPVDSHPAGERGRNGSRILLADDNAVNRKVGVRLLELLNYPADVAENGRAAITAWQTGGYDLILMDCQMPELDGYEATREIRRLEGGGRHIPIIALTTHAMKGADEECAAAGMDGYLTKPIDRLLLAEMLELHLGAPAIGRRAL